MVLINCEIVNIYAHNPIPDADGIHKTYFCLCLKISVDKINVRHVGFGTIRESSQWEDLDQRFTMFGGR